jgi:hypothetical protein
VIILSGVLVVLAIALLVTGIVTGNTGHEVAGLDGLKLIYVSIGVSIVSALFLAIGVFLRRKELFGTAGVQAPAKASTAVGRASKAARPAKAKARVGAGEETPVPVASATATDVPAETTVYVVPGRKRYHLKTCRQLAGRDKEELTFVEAREEGFTACTACLPDTALAARAALTDMEPADDRSADSAAVPADSEPERPTQTLPQVTRADLPITKRETVAAEPAGPSDRAEADEHAEPVAEQPAEPRRSLFEPLHRTGPVTATDDATTDEENDDDNVTAEPSDTEDLAAGEQEQTTAAEPEDTAPGEPAEAVTAPADEDDELAADAGRQAAERTLTTDVPESAADGGADAHAVEDDGPADDAAGEDAADDDGPDDARADDDGPNDARADDDAVNEDGTNEDGTNEDGTNEDGTNEDGTNEDGTNEDAADDEGAGAATPRTVRILSGTKRYHRPDCALIEDIAEDADDLETMPQAEAKERGCTPCLVCQPDKDPSDDEN